MAKSAAAKPKSKKKKASSKKKSTAPKPAAPATAQKEAPKAPEPSTLDLIEEYLGSSTVWKYVNSLWSQPNKSESKPAPSSPVIDASKQGASTAPAAPKESGAGDQELGVLSSKYESNGNPGTVSSGVGDPGGKSYGAYQFSSTQKVIDDFYAWLKNHDADIYAVLEAGYKEDGNKFGDKFNAAFEKLGKDKPKEFLKLQHDYTKTMYYDKAANKIKDKFGLDINTRSFALKNVIWSRAVQHGVGSKSPGLLYVLEVAFKDMDMATATDEQLIRAIYKESGKLVEDAPSTSSKKMDADEVKKSKSKAIKGVADEVDGKYMGYFSKSGNEMQAGVYYRLNKGEPEQALKLLYGKDYKFTGL